MKKIRIPKRVMVVFIPLLLAGTLVLSNYVSVKFEQTERKAQILSQQSEKKLTSKGVRLTHLQNGKLVSRLSADRLESSSIKLTSFNLERPNVDFYFDGQKMANMQGEFGIFDTGKGFTISGNLILDSIINDEKLYLTAESGSFEIKSRTAEFKGNVKFNYANSKNKAGSLSLTF